MGVENENQILWKGRSEICVQGVKELLRFDETVAEFLTGDGQLVISGEGIHVSGLNLEQGSVHIHADSIDAAEYAAFPRESTVGGWKRLFFRS